MQSQCQPIGTFKDSDLIINYHDAVIYGSDLKLLKNRTEWLNDSCIHFFFVLLQQRHREQEQEREREQKETLLSSSSSSSFLFMDPSVVSYWMHQCTDQDDIEDFVNNTNFPKSKGRNGNGGGGGGGVIFIAVNDDMALSSNGWQIPNSGSHWSLLLIIVGCGDDNKNNNNNNDEDEDDSEVSHIRSFCFLHFDSIRNSRNIRAANDIAKKIMLHVYSDDNNKRKRDSDSDSSNNDKPKVIQVETPQQRNGYDCGVHVLGAAKILSSSSTTTSLTIYSNNDNNNSDSMNSVRLNSLEESLQQGVGNNSFDFCTKLRDEISSEILHLSSSASS